MHQFAQIEDIVDDRAVNLLTDERTAVATTNGEDNTTIPLAFGIVSSTILCLSFSNICMNSWLVSEYDWLDRC